MHIYLLKFYSLILKTKLRVLSNKNSDSSYKLVCSAIVEYSDLTSWDFWYSPLLVKLPFICLPFLMRNRIKSNCCNCCGTEVRKM